MPKAKDTTFDQIGIGLRDGMPEAMELHDSFGQASVLTFNEVRKESGAAATASSDSSMPKGADVFSN